MKEFSRKSKKIIITSSLNFLALINSSFSVLKEILVIKITRLFGKLTSLAKYVKLTC